MQDNNTLIKPNYRPDIQGLRAIAVLLVFFSHAHWYPFSGGFIGVDIFFVISGYVITLLLVKEYRIKGTLIFHQFYARRLQRLLPALIFMVIIISSLSLILLTPIEQVFHYDGGISALLWLSNLYYQIQDLNYFSPLANSQLFLHTWSLGIEEQFYLIWPILLLAGFRFWIKSNKALINLYVFILTIMFISILFLAYFSFNSNNMAFYFMPSRVWQFGLGGIIAILHCFNSNFFDNKKINNLLELFAIVGISMILFSSIMFEIYTPYPNWQVFIPSIGVALVILPKYHYQNSSVATILAFKPLVFIGNVSYSFYLWHWPILLYCKKLNVYFPFLNSFVAFLLTILMTLISYYLIEQPIRKSGRFKSKPKVAITVFLLAMTLSIIFMLFLNSFSRKLAKDKDQQYYKISKETLPIVYQQGCDDWYKSDRVVKCEFGNIDSTNEVIVFGDSVLFQWFPAILDYYEKLNWHVIAFVKNGCPIINRPFFYYRIMAVYSNCDSWRKSVINEIIKIKPNVILIGNSNRYPFNKQEWQEGSKEIIDRLSPIANKIKLIAGTPALDFDASICMANKSWLSRIFPSLKETECSKAFKPDEVWQWQKNIVQMYENVQFVELSQYICPGSKCRSIIDGVMVFRDSVHLTVEFVLSQKNILDKYLSN